MFLRFLGFCRIRVSKGLPSNLYRGISGNLTEKGNLRYSRKVIVGGRMSKNIVYLYAIKVESV